MFCGDSSCYTHILSFAFPRLLEKQSECHPYIELNERQWELRAFESEVGFSMLKNKLIISTFKDLCVRIIELIKAHFLNLVRDISLT